MKILFLSFTCEDIGVAMVTNMISQLQESFPLRRAAGSFEISFCYRIFLFFIRIENTCNKVAKAVKQCSIHFLSVELCFGTENISIIAFISPL